MRPFHEEHFDSRTERVAFILLMISVVVFIGGHIARAIF